MSGIRPRLREALPADVAARPVAPARTFPADEVPELNRLLRLEDTVAIPVVGDARRRAYAGAAEDGERLVAAKEVRQRLAVRRGAVCVAMLVRQVFDASNMLAMDASSIALNSASDCCAVRPSASAREKLATMPFCRDSRSLASSRV